MKELFEKIDSDDDYATYVGEKIANLLGLVASEHGMYDSAYGWRTAAGIAHIIAIVLCDEYDREFKS